MLSGKGTQAGEDQSSKSLFVSIIKVVCIGLGIILSSDFFFWTNGLMAGWKIFLGCTLFIIVGYFMMIYALFELTSAVSFSGGAFGYVRCTLGPFAGFLVACCQLMLYNFYTLCSVYSAARGMHVGFTTLDSRWEPALFLATYVPVVVLQLVDDKYFWVTTIAVVVLTVSLILSICGIEFFVNSAYWHDLTWADHQDNPTKGFFSHLCSAASFFLGIESILVVSDRVPQSTRVMPISLMSTFAIVLVVTFLIFFMFVIMDTQTAHPLALEEFPFSYALHRTLSLPMYLGPIFTVPSSIGSAVCFMYLAKHLLVSMSKSGLVNAIFHQTFWAHEVPLYAVGSSFLVQFAVLMISYLSTRDMPFLYIAITGAAVNYIGILAAYIVFHYKFPSIPRRYRNPFGVIGATIGICIFAVVFFSNAIYAVKHQVSKVFFISMFFAGVYYFWVVEKRQFFSEEEQKHFMKAYILNANKRKRLSPWRRFLLTVTGMLPSWAINLISTVARTAPSNQQSTNHASKNSEGNSRLTNTKGGEVSQSLGIFNQNKVAPLPSEDGARSIVVPMSTLNLPDDSDHGHANKDQGEVRGAQNTTTTSTALDVETGLLTSTRVSISTTTRVAGLSTTQQQANDDCGIVASSALDVSPSGKQMRSGSIKIAPVVSGKALAWSGKVLSTRQSQVFFQLLHSEDFASSPAEVAPLPEPSTEQMNLEAGVSNRGALSMLNATEAVNDVQDGAAVVEDDDVLAARLAHIVAQTLPENFHILSDDAANIEQQGDAPLEV